MKNKKSNKAKLPRIYRFITDHSLFLILLLSVFLFIFVLAGMDLVDNIKKSQAIESQRNEIYSQLQYWEKIVEKYKGYRDGYFELAVFNYRLNNTEKAKDYLKKVLKLDPNFEQGKELGKVLTSNPSK